MSERTFWMVPWAKSSRHIFILSKIQNVYFTDSLEASLMLDDGKPLTNTRSNERTWVNLQNQPPESVGPNILQEICYRPTNEPLKRSATSFQSRQGTKRVNIYMMNVALLSLSWENKRIECRWQCNVFASHNRWRPVECYSMTGVRSSIFFYWNNMDVQIFS